MISRRPGRFPTAAPLTQPPDRIDTAVGINFRGSVAAEDLRCSPGAVAAGNAHRTRASCITQIHFTAFRFTQRTERTAAGRAPRRTVPTVGP
jgi:hypothetical protein